MRLTSVAKYVQRTCLRRKLRLFWFFCEYLPADHRATMFSWNGRCDNRPVTGTVTINNCWQFLQEPSTVDRTSWRFQTLGSKNATNFHSELIPETWSWASRSVLWPELKLICFVWLWELCNKISQLRMVCYVCHVGFTFARQNPCWLLLISFHCVTLTDVFDST